jgi:O-antigen/teichoic acid export membrane protein
LSLKSQAISGVKWTTLSTIITTILQLIQLAILARFLDPSAFGLMALVMVVVGFSQAFLDMGISNAIIHKQEIIKDQLSTLYWVNVLAGFALFIVISAISPLVASFYHEPELTMLIILVGVTFLIQPFGQQFMVLWQKEMRFSEIAKIDIASKFISLMVSVYFAYEGYGVYALVYGTLAGVAVQTILFMYKGLQEHKPSFVFKLNEIKEFLSFGAYQMGERSINYFTSQADTIIIGKLLGMEALGLYNLVKQIIEKSVYTLNSIMNKITFPMFSKIQNDEIKLKEIYLKVLGILTFIQYPILATQFFYGYDILLFILGDKWIGTEELIKLFAIYSLFLVYGNPTGALLLSKGKANWGFYSNAVYFVLYPVSIYLFINLYGLNGALYGYIFIGLLSIYPYWKLMISKLINVEFFEYNKYFIVQSLISFITAFVAYKISFVFDMSFMYKFLIYSFSMVILYGLVNMIFNREILSAIRRINK